MLTGNEFQTLGAENQKARDPKVSLLLWMVVSGYNRLYSSFQ